MKPTKMKPTKKKQNAFSEEGAHIEMRYHPPTLRAFISNMPRRTWVYLFFSVSGYLIACFLLPALVDIVRNYIDIQQNPLIEGKQKLDTSLEIFKTLISGAGTLATIVGGIFLYLNFKVARKNTEIAESRLITERFSKAVEQLADKDRQAVRLGGIYSLERIAKNSPDDHWTVIEVLTSFVRDQSPVTDNSSNEEISTEIQAILDVISRRNTGAETEENSINLCGTNLPHANFYKAKLIRIYFLGANFYKSNFTKAELNGVVLLGAKLDCAVFSEAKLFAVSLDRARMASARLHNAEIYRSKLNNANFYQSSFIEAKIEFTSAHETDFTEADFTQSSLLGCDLSGSNFEGAKFEKTDISGSIFLKAQNLTVEQILKALNYDRAYYDPAFRETLGLMPDTRKIPVNFFEMLFNISIDKASQNNDP